MLTLPTTKLIASWRRSLHDKRPRTVDLYLSIVEQFAGWLDQSRGDDDLTTVTRRDCEAWFTEQRDRGLAPATMRSRWIALRSLYRWLTEESEVDNNPMAKVVVSRAEPGPVDTPSIESLKAVLATCDGKGFLDRRDRALIRLMAATGLRVAEACALEERDVDLDSRTVLVRNGKGGKSRIVRIDPATTAALDAYVRVRARHQWAKLHALWLSQFGALTRKGIPAVLRARALRAGVDHLHPHQLRHFFADQWLRGGGSEGDLLRLGGWESPDVMRRYGRAHAVERALDAYDDVNPAGQL